MATGGVVDWEAGIPAGSRGGLGAPGEERESGGPLGGSGWRASTVSISRSPSVVTSSLYLSTHSRSTCPGWPFPWCWCWPAVHLHAANLGSHLHLRVATLFVDFIRAWISTSSMGMLVRSAPVVVAETSCEVDSVWSVAIVRIMQGWERGAFR